VDKIHFGKYVAVEEIGRGGMSIVYKGNHPTLSKPVAIKVLSDFLSSDMKFIARFQKEADLLSSFRHANIVSILDYGKQDSDYYIVMDYIEGFTVQQMIAETGALSLDIISNILLGVATALAYTHRKSIVHQDIKSSNIMIDNNGHIMVTDFGLSRNVSLDNIEQIDHEIVGTLSYCAPEQLDHKMGKIDATTDIYSLGVVFYQMATGQLPFADENTSVNIAYQHINVIPESPKKLKPDLLLKASSMIMKMLKKKQSERYQNMEEVLKDIQELQEVSQYYRPKYDGDKDEGSFFVIQSDGDDSKMGKNPTKRILQDEEGIEYLSNNDESGQPSEEEMRLDSAVDSENEPMDIEEDQGEDIELEPQDDMDYSFDSDPYIGKEIKHRYRIQKLLLRRILSKLYYGVDLVKDIPVTIQLPNESRPTFKTRINREIQTMKKIDHPGFVKFLDVIEEDGVYFVVREYVEGTSVKNLLKQEQFSIKRSVSIALEVLDALAYLHQRKIIHRDLNSDVVMIPKKGRIRISSLGFTRVEDASSVSSGEFLGVVQYTAPEQIIQSFSDARTDIYAVGILLFEMLTGSPPFDSTLPVEVMDMHLKKIPRFPEESQRGIPLTLQSVVLKALAKQPEQRFQTAEEMQEALGTFLRSFTGKQSDNSLSDQHEKEESDSGLKNNDQTSKTGSMISSDTGLYRDLQKNNTTRKPVSFSIKNKPSVKINQDNKIDIRKIINQDLKMDTRTKETEGKQSFTNEMDLKEKAVYEETQKKNHSKVDFAGSHSPTFSMKNTKHDSNEKGASSLKKRIWLPIILIPVVIGLLLFLINPFSKPQTVKEPESVVGANYLEWLSPKSVNEVFLSPLVPTTIEFRNDSWQLGNSYAIKDITPSVEYRISSSSEDGIFFITLFSSNPDLEKLVQFTLQYLGPNGEILNEVTYTIANLPESVSEISINYDKATYSLNGKQPQINEPNILIYQEKIYIPIRFLIRVFNAELSYDFEEEKIVIQNLDQHKYVFYLFKNKYIVDNHTVTGVNPILEINDTAYLPIDFLSLKMHFSVIFERNIEDHFVIRLIKNRRT
jgi:serine/threonine protein kinase